jgi:DnaJ-class molecular chaperone
LLQEAKDKFQQLQKVISILGDEEKRAVYDQTGSIDDADIPGDAFENLRDFFRDMYKKVAETFTSDTFYTSASAAYTNFFFLCCCLYIGQRS